MKEKRFTQSTLSVKLGTSRQQVGHYLRSPDFKVSTLKQVAGILGVGVQVFFDEEDFYDVRPTSNLAEEPTTEYGKKKYIEDRVSFLEEKLEELATKINNDSPQK